LVWRGERPGGDGASARVPRDQSCVYNIYHDAHSNDVEDNDDRRSRGACARSLNHITSLEIDPLVPAVIGGDFHTHARAWSPPDIC
jgi:hypothetical protein